MDVRLLTAGEMEEAIRLADGTFRGDDRPSLSDSSPNVFSKSLGQAAGGFADGRLVSFAGLVPSVVRIGAARLHVYSYGAVCTHPDYRGKGLASSILDFAKRHIRRADASLLLVSGGRSLYTNAGCYPFGMFRRFTLLPEHTPHLAKRESSGISCRTADAADWFRLGDMSAAKPVHYEQSVWDMALLHQARAVPSMQRLDQVTIIAEKEGEAVAFCVLGLRRIGEEPGKRSDSVIEWGGRAEDVCSLLRFALSHKLTDRLDIGVSWHEEEMAELLGGTGAAWTEEQNSGTVHIACAEKLFRQLRPYWEQISGRPGTVPAVRSLTDGTFEVVADDCSPLLCNGEQLVSLLFDKEPKELTLDEQWRSAASTYFPIPFPYTKGLNYV
jgi:GNAT superfamily N-acetyltransferase